MSESSVHDLIRDELAGWHIGSGYYATAVSVDDARDMADALLAVLRDLPDDVIEQAAEGGVVERFTHEVEVLRAENHILHLIVEIQAGRLAEQQIEQGGEP